ncbi:glucose transporter 4 enhancer factor isoform X2 [Musca autumnalis]|uniref:glucose transporter 4 enhancer factor isoform X2 n=1 Tax=Musca autumnalis TaxID=221902 RepID=UPI003CE79268
MSTGRRLAKRSIIGTKVCAPGPDGLWYSGVIQDVKTPPTATITSANATAVDSANETKYIVRFDFKTQDNVIASTSAAAEARRHAAASVHISPAQTLRRNAMIKEFRETDLIGPGFRSILGVKLQPGQRVYLTYNGRETSGDVILHDSSKDEVLVKITTIGSEEPIELKKRLEEVRLLESRRSARLADQDTDFARLADMGGDRRKPSHSIEVPLSATPQHNSRKRPPSCATECNGGGGDQYDEEEMNENNAAMILVTLSLSPKSPKNGDKWLGSSPGSSSASWSSGSSSPPLSDDGHNMGVITNDASASARIRTTSVSTSDEGIVVDFKEDAPRKKRANKTRFVCTWKGCTISEHTKAKIERHIRIVHLGKKARRTADHVDSDSHDSDSHEEEFYYTEVEDDDDDCKTPSPTSPPTLSHRDMARPPHEDPEYQRQLVGNFKHGRVAAQQQHINGRQIHHVNGQTVYISSSQHQQLQNNNTSCIPTSPLAHHNYTWPPVATATTAITTSPITNTSNNAAANNYHNHQHQQQQQQQQQQSTTSPQLIKHARASPRPSQTAAPYPSPTYVHQHHNYSSPAPASPNNVTSASIVHHNNSANSVLQQLSQQNVTVTTHHSNSHHHHQSQHQQQQQQLATVTITPNYTQVRGVRGTNGGQDTNQTHQLQQQHHHHHPQHQQQQHTLAHQQQQQQPQHHLQHSPTATASNRMVASNNPNCSPSSNATTATGHLHHQQHVAVQHANRQTPNSPNRRTRGENKKCRKVYGMERRDMWCTQCRWKKACSRFGD